MEEYKPNSHRSKEERKESIPEKHVEKVISGTVKPKKKSEITKMCLCGIVSSNIKMWEEPDGTRTRMNRLQTQPVFVIYGEKL